MNAPAGKTGMDWRFLVLGLVSLVAIAGAFSLPPVPQDPAYHDFADQRRLLGVNNFWDVVSNLPFLFVGAWALVSRDRLDHRIAPGAQLYALGLILIGFGSAWYHLAPTNESLFWDRLPMTLSFAAFFCFALQMVSDRPLVGRLLWPLVLTGAASVLFWSYTESQGTGDLRFYALVQFLPGLLIVLMLLMYPRRFQNRRLIFIALLWYLAAKLLEWQDALVFDMLPLSGHSLKHVAAAAGSYYGVRAMLLYRHAVSSAPAGD